MFHINIYMIYNGPCSLMVQQLLKFNTRKTNIMLTQATYPFILGKNTSVMKVQNAHPIFLHSMDTEGQVLSVRVDKYNPYLLSFHVLSGLPVRPLRGKQLFDCEHVNNVLILIRCRFLHPVYLFSNLR